MLDATHSLSSIHNGRNLYNSLVSSYLGLLSSFDQLSVRLGPAFCHRPLSFFSSTSFKHFESALLLLESTLHCLMAAAIGSLAALSLLDASTPILSETRTNVIYAPGVFSPFHNPLFASLLPWLLNKLGHFRISS